MAKKTLQQFVESTKHTFITRIIVSSSKVVTKKLPDQYSFIAWVKKIHKDACESLSRRGRDSLTSIIVYDVWQKKDVLEYLASIDKEVPENLALALENDSEYCFCHCNIKIRDIKVQGPSR